MLNNTSLSYPTDGHDNCFALEDNSFWFQHRNEVLLTLMKSYPPPGEFYDVGGGNGYVTRRLVREGYPAVLVEPSPTGARNGSKRGLTSVICSTLEDSGIKERSIPAIGLFDVIEHIEDDLQYLSMVRSFLAPKGRLYITVPAYGWLWSSEDSDGGHFRRYTRKSLRKVLVEAGFQVDFESYFFWALPLPLFCFRTLPSALGLRKSISQEVSQREHRPSTGFVGRILGTLLRAELTRLRKGKTIPFGGSCVAIATKVER